MLNKAKKAEKRELQRLAEQAERERQAEEAPLQAERIARLTLEREAEIAKHEAEEFARLRLLVENGTTTYVHTEKHLPVDARMNVLGAAGGLTSLLDEINRHGLQGWEVVLVVPRTYGDAQHRCRCAGGPSRRPCRRRLRPAQVCDHHDDSADRGLGPSRIRVRGVRRPSTARRERDRDIRPCGEPSPRGREDERARFCRRTDEPLRRDQSVGTAGLGGRLGGTSHPRGISWHKSVKTIASGTLNIAADAQEVHLGGHAVGGARVS